MSLPSSPINPNKRGNKQKDFILISEFSELVGPVAVVSIVH